MLEAVKFFQEIRSGSSLPLVVGTQEGAQYVVKLRGSGEGVLANVVEWLSLQLGLLAGIPVVEPVLMNIPSGFEHQARDPEIKELLQRSAGLNLATRYVAGAQVYGKPGSPALAQALQDRIFLYDLFLMNVDRNLQNPNMISSAQGVRCLDYAAAVTMRSAVSGENFNELALLRELKRHLFYREDLSAYEFIRAFAALDDHSVGACVEALPAAWLQPGPEWKAAGEEARQLMRQRLLAQKNGVHGLLKKLDLMRVLKVMTSAERNARALENRKAFERKFGKL